MGRCTYVGVDPGHEHAHAEDAERRAAGDGAQAHRQLQTDGGLIRRFISLGLAALAREIDDLLPLMETSARFMRMYFIDL